LVGLRLRKWINPLGPRGAGFVSVSGIEPDVGDFFRARVFVRRTANHSKRFAGDGRRPSGAWRQLRGRTGPGGRHRGCGGEVSSSCGPPGVGRPAADLDRHGSRGRFAGRLSARGGGAAVFRLRLRCSNHGQGGARRDPPPGWKFLFAGGIGLHSACAPKSSCPILPRRMKSAPQKSPSRKQSEENKARARILLVTKLLTQPIRA